MSTFNVKTVSLCIFLFLASSLLTLTLRNNAHSINLRPQSPSNSNNNAAKVAFATFLAGNFNPSKKPTDAESAAINDEDDGYYIGTRVLLYQLLHSRSAGTNASIPLIVLCTTDVSARKRARLRKEGATVVVVEKMAAAWANPNTARWADNLVKLRLFQLTEYTKICFIDADTLVTASLDGVFYDEATLTQPTLPNPAQLKSDEPPLPRTYTFASHGDYYGYDHPYPPDPNLNYLNAGFFVFAPSTHLFDYYMGVLNIPNRFDPGFMEQNLLNYAHRREGNMPWKPLWYGWNVNWPTERDLRAGARSFHAKYWDGDPSHDPVLKGIWREQRAEMEGFWRGREWDGR